MQTSPRGFWVAVNSAGRIFFSSHNSVGVVSYVCCFATVLAVALCGGIPWDSFPVSETTLLSFSPLPNPCCWKPWETAPLTSAPLLPHHLPFHTTSPFYSQANKTPQNKLQLRGFFCTVLRLRVSLPPCLTGWSVCRVFVTKAKQPEAGISTVSLVWGLALMGRRRR